MILVRRLLTSFEGDALFTAIHLLCQTERHPATAGTIAKTFRWTILDILHLFTRVGWEQWQRGDVGEGVYSLLVKDTNFEAKVRRAFDEAMDADLPDAAWVAVYLTVYWAGEAGPDVYRQLVAQHPSIRQLELAVELESILCETGHVSLF